MSQEFYDEENQELVRTAGDEEHGRRLDQVLASLYSDYSRSKIKKWIEEGRVTLDGRVCTVPRTLVESGMEIGLTPEAADDYLAEPQDIPFETVYEDKDIIVIEKAAGILSMAVSAKQFCIKTVLDQYFERRHFKCHAHCVHRLDKDTSGLMIYAKSIEAAQIMQDDWKGRVFDRRYCAVLVGEMEQEGGTVRSYLTDRKLITVSSPVDDGGKLAVTHYHRLRTGNGFTLAEMRLETGRKNQIRVHMQDVGYPVVGDPKYGLEGMYVPNPLGRLCLHAYRLFFYHPITGQRMEFETPIPGQFEMLINEQ